MQNRYSQVESGAGFTYGQSCQQLIPFTSGKHFLNEVRGKSRLVENHSSLERVPKNQHSVHDSNMKRQHP